MIVKYYKYYDRNSVNMIQKTSYKVKMKQYVKQNMK